MNKKFCLMACLCCGYQALNATVEPYVPVPAFPFLTLTTTPSPSTSRTGEQLTATI